MKCTLSTLPAWADCLTCPSPHHSALSMEVQWKLLPPPLATPSPSSSHTLLFPYSAPSSLLHLLPKSLSLLTLCPHLLIHLCPSPCDLVLSGQTLLLGERENPAKEWLGLGTHQEHQETRGQRGDSCIENIKGKTRDQNSDSAEIEEQGERTTQAAGQDREGNFQKETLQQTGMSPGDFKVYLQVLISNRVLPTLFWSLDKLVYIHEPLTL